MAPSKASAGRSERRDGAGCGQVRDCSLWRPPFGGPSDGSVSLRGAKMRANGTTTMRGAGGQQSRRQKQDQVHGLPVVSAHAAKMAPTSSWSLLPPDGLGEKFAPSPRVRSQIERSSFGREVEVEDRVSISGHERAPTSDKNSTPSAQETKCSLRFEELTGDEQNVRNLPQDQLNEATKLRERRRRRERERAREFKGNCNERTESIDEIHRSAKRHKRQSSIGLRGKSAHCFKLRRQATIMRPNWRQLILLSFVSILLTTLLANFWPTNRVFSGSCLLFNHCHALSVQSSSSPPPPPPPLIAGGKQLGPLAGGGANELVLGSTTQRPQQQQLAPPATHLGAVTTQPTRQLHQPANFSGANKQPAMASSENVASLHFAPLNGNDNSNSHNHKLVLNQINSLSSQQSNNKKTANKIVVGAGKSSALFANAAKRQQLKQQQVQQVDNNNSNNYANSTEPIGNTNNNGNQRKWTFAAENSNNNNNDNLIASSSSNLEGIANANDLSHGANATGQVRSQFHATKQAAGATKGVEELVIGRRPSEAHQRTSAPMSMAASPMKVISSPMLSSGQIMNTNGESLHWSAANNSTSTTATRLGGWTIVGNLTEGSIESEQNQESSNKANSTRPPALEPGKPGAFAEQPNESRQRQRHQAKLEPQLAMPHEVLESVVREALIDLMSGASDELVELGPRAPSRPPTRQVAYPILATVAGTPSAYPGEGRQVRHGAQLKPQQKLSSLVPEHQAFHAGPPLLLPTAASASAPSVSLPPFSHLLVPRNPFRLFASSSTPTSSRHRPGAPAANPQPSASKQGSRSLGRWFINPFNVQTSASNNKANLNQPPARPQPSAQFQGTATLTGLDPAELTGSAGPSLYAHSHSAEQLEKLIKAATQVTGVKSPILPAIVSGPTGAFPGFYIPAIESESESQIQELRHGEPQHSMTHSKIPGTDYILHPDEVRAMINIGELAWRKQQTGAMLMQQPAHQTQASSPPALALVNPAHLGQHQASESSDRGWRIVHSPELGHLRPGNFMQENHAANIRDYAYVMPAAPSAGADQPPANDQLQSQSQTSGTTQVRQTFNSFPARMNASDLESQLAQHFRQNQLISFPAIIRVNDQDYIHWPLINNAQQSQPEQASNQRGQGLMALANTQSQQRQTGGVKGYQQAAQNGEQVASSVQSGANNNNNYAMDMDRHPVRLATQLTPHEIRQVEDSVLETLIMAKTIQQQRKMMETLANANQLAPVYRRPNENQQQQQQQQYNQRQPLASWMSNWSSHLMAPNSAGANNHNNNNRFKSGFFGRRRRRNLSEGQKQRPDTIKSAASSSVPRSYMEMVPLINASTIPLQLVEAPLVHYAMNEHLAAPILIAPKLIDPSRRLLLPAAVLLADQETNKPRQLAESGANSETQFSESTAPRVSLASPNSGLNNDDDSSASFGTRVSSRTKNSTSQQPAKVLQTPGKAAPQTHVTFIPIPRQKLFADPPLVVATSATSSGSKAAKASESRTGNGKDPIKATASLHRLNVDWPGMVSDADYFPGKEADDNRGHAGPGPSDSVAPQTRLPVAAAASLEPAAGPEPIRQPLINNRNFITSQMKLQFTQDYQAREGVPIYNNNVRVAGALDRMRALDSLARPAGVAPTTGVAGRGAEQALPAGEMSEPEEEEIAREMDDSLEAASAKRRSVRANKLARAAGASSGEQEQGKEKEKAT